MKPNSRHRRLRVEQLEPRLALAPTPVQITGTAGADIITVNAVAGSPVEITYTVNGVTSGPVQPDGPIRISGLAGADQITVAANVYLPTLIDGGPGADLLTGGSGDDSFLARDNTLDTIVGNAGLNSATTDSLDLITGIQYVNPIVESNTNRTQHVKVLVVNFDPQIPSQGNRRLYEIFNWNNPRALAAGYEADLERNSGGAVEFEIVEWRDLNEIPAFTDGFRYSPDDYYQNRSTNTNWHTATSADFPRIASEQGLVPLIDSGAVDEVWFFGDHYFALPGESWMSGPGAFFINGPTFPQIATQRPFASMGFSYERGVAEMLHNNGHRTESTLNRVYGGWNLASPISNWDRFSANFAQSNGVAGVGTTHYPANAASDYDTSNPRVVQSWADDYLNYPNLTGATQPVSRDTWGKGTNPDYERSYQNWYFTHMPRADDVNADLRQNNWWKYLYDFQNYSSSGTPLAPAASAQAEDLFNLGGTKYQFQVTYKSAAPVRWSTLDGSDLTVRGPNGFQVLPRLASVSDEDDDTYIVATYEFDAPGGTWNAPDSGAYTIQLNASQVTTITGVAFPASTVGSFLVRGVGAVALAADADTLLKLPLDGNATGAAGETPSQSPGVTYAAGKVQQGAAISNTGRLVYDQANNIAASAGTVEFWIRPTWDANGTTHQFFQAGNDFNKGMLLSIDGANNLRFIQWGDDPATPAIETGVERGVGASGAGWKADEWHHLAATWDSAANTMAFYVDGRLAGSASGATIDAFTNTTLSIGARRDGSRPAEAMFDEVRISSRARSAGEIQADYSSGIAFVSVSLAGNPTTLSQGVPQSFVATAVDETGVSRDVSGTVAWSSSVPLTASVDAEGEVSPLAAGPTTVSAALGTLTASLGVTVQDAGRPTAQMLNSGSLVTTYGGTSFAIVVRYTDSNGVKVSSLGLGDVRVRNEQGASAFATLTSVDVNTDGTPRQATYQFTPPGGYWDPSDNGAYFVELMANQVYDVGNVAAAGNPALGQFQVTVAPLTPPATLTLALSLSQISEHNGSTQATVTRTNADTSAALTVTLTSSDVSEATVPASVVIPANQASATFTVTGVDDLLADGSQNVVITASAAGAAAAQKLLIVTDNEPLSPLHNYTNAYDVDNDTDVDIDDVLVIFPPLRLERYTPGFPHPPGPPYVDVNGDARLTIDDPLQVLVQVRARRFSGGEGESATGRLRQAVVAPPSAITSSAPSPAASNLVLDLVAHDITLAKKKAAGQASEEREPVVQ